MQSNLVRSVDGVGAAQGASSISATQPRTRHFVIVTEPSIADPAWLIPMYEVVAHCGFVDHIDYRSFDELKDLVRILEHRMTYDAGRSKGCSDVLKVLGISLEQYREAERLARSQKCLDCGHLIQDKLEFECMECARFPMCDGCWINHQERKHEQSEVG